MSTHDYLNLPEQMAKLTDAQKMFVVERLACFCSVSEIQKEAKETFDIDVPPSTILLYNPETIQGQKDLTDRWKQLFAEARERFLSNIAAIPIANKSYRLRELQNLYNANKNRSPVVAADLLEQAAKEEGGAYTNARILSGPGGGDVRVTVAYERPTAGDSGPASGAEEDSF